MHAGRQPAAGAELSAHVGLTAGRVRMAGFASAIGSLVPAAAPAPRHPSLEISLTDAHPPEAKGGPAVTARATA